MAEPTTAQRKAFAKAGIAMPDGSYYIRNAADLQNAIEAVGRGEPQSSHDGIRKHIMARAGALHLSKEIPADWNPDGSLKHDDPVAEFLEHFGVQGMEWGHHLKRHDHQPFIRTANGGQPQQHDHHDHQQQADHAVHGMHQLHQQAEHDAQQSKQEAAKNPTPENKAAHAVNTAHAAAMKKTATAASKANTAHKAAKLPAKHPAQKAHATKMKAAHVKAKITHAVHKVKTSELKAYNKLSASQKASLAKLSPAQRASLAKLTPAQRKTLAKMTPAQKTALSHLTQKQKDALAKATKASAVKRHAAALARKSGVTKVAKTKPLTTAQKASLAKLTPAQRSSLARLTSAQRKTLAKMTPAQKKVLSGLTQKQKDALAKVTITRGSVKQSDDVEEFLAHYGIKGMKWGIRKARSGESSFHHPVSEDAARARAHEETVRKHGTNALSNQDLQHLVNRRNLEQQHASIAGKNRTAGQKFVDSLVKDATNQAQREAGKLVAEYAAKGAAYLATEATRQLLGTRAGIGRHA